MCYAQSAQTSWKPTTNYPPAPAPTTTSINSTFSTDNGVTLPDPTLAMKRLILGTLGGNFAQQAREAQLGTSIRPPSPPVTDPTKAF